MYAEQALPLFEVTRPQATSVVSTAVGRGIGFAEPVRPSGYASPATVRGQRFVRSVVESAGLGSFAYLHGASGKRYVFSAVRGNQVALYNHAVFALAGADGALERIVTRRELPDCSQSVSLYVHLLEDDCADIHSVIDDMTSAA